MLDSITIPGLERRLRINTIFGIGRNYVAHAHELKNEVPKNPVIFIKPVTSIIYSGDTIRLPFQSQNVHYETELVVAIGKSGKNIPIHDALSYVEGYGIGIDVTARDLQQQAKEKSLPWAVSKGFDTFAPISDFIPAAEVEDPQKLTFELEVNGEIRQSGDTSKMIFPVAHLISELSRFFTLNAGDLIFSGTPEGVGPMQSGDHLKASLCGKDITLEVGVS